MQTAMPYVLAALGGALGALARWAAATVGVLGGFTTFSAFAVEVVEQVDAGAAVLAAAYVLASVVGGIGAVALGARAGQALTGWTAR